MDTQLIWHYTMRDRLPKIIQSGHIKLATVGVPAGEKPGVWFSTNPVWEKTCNKLAVDAAGRLNRLSKEETERLCGGLVRIAVAPEAALCDWEDFITLSGISDLDRFYMLAATVQVGGNTGEWRVSFAPIPISSFLDIEIWQNGKWQSIACVYLP